MTDPFEVFRQESLTSKSGEKNPDEAAIKHPDGPLRVHS